MIRFVTGRPITFLLGVAALAAAFLVLPQQVSRYRLALAVDAYCRNVDALPADAIVAFRRLQSIRPVLDPKSALYPQVHDAEERWAVRAVGALCAACKALGVDDWDSFSKDGDNRRFVMDQFPSAAGSIARAQSDWLGPYIDRALDRIQPTLTLNPSAGSAALDDLALRLRDVGGAAQFLSARRRLFSAVLADAQRDALESLQANDINEATVIACLFAKDFAGEAKAVGMKPDLDGFADAYIFLATLRDVASDGTAAVIRPHPNLEGHSPLR